MWICVIRLERLGVFSRDYGWGGARGHSAILSGPLEYINMARQEGEVVGITLSGSKREREREREFRGLTVESALN